MSSREGGVVDLRAELRKHSQLRLGTECRHWGATGNLCGENIFGIITKGMYGGKGICCALRRTWLTLPRVLAIDFPTTCPHQKCFITPSILAAGVPPFRLHRHLMTCLCASLVVLLQRLLFSSKCRGKVSLLCHT